jgi:hypothetical protein
MQTSIRSKQESADFDIEVLKTKFFFLDVCFEQAVAWLTTHFCRGRENGFVKAFQRLRTMTTDYFCRLARAQGLQAEENGRLKADLFNTKQTSISPACLKEH